MSDITPADALRELRDGDYPDYVAAAKKIESACKCGDCYHPVIGPNTDGEPCDWCRDCACPSADHTRMTYTESP